MNKLWAIVILICTTSSALAAPADTPAKRRAINLWAAGTKLFAEAVQLENDGEFVEARQRFVEAARTYVRSVNEYEFEEVVYSLAQAKRRAGLLDSALVSYQYHLKRYPASPRRTLVERRIQEIKFMIAWAESRSCRKRK